MNNDDERDYEEEAANRALLRDETEYVTDYLKDIPAPPTATLLFTPAQFDKGYAHELVRSVTGNANIFPGWWRETWEFDSSIKMWSVIIESR